jgi:hypothetical protein
MFWLQRFFEPGYRLLMRVMNDGFAKATKKLELQQGASAHSEPGRVEP